MFSIIGAGLSNPFRVCNERELKEFQRDRSTLGGDSHNATERTFEKYLDAFWYCLYEKPTWVREAVNGILQETHWEAIPIVLRSLDKTYRQARKSKREGKNIIEDTVYLLKNLANVAWFPAGIYLGGEQIVGKCFQFIHDVRKDAFKADRIDKKKWWPTQTNFVDFFGYFLRTLSKIGAHRELRREFWDNITLKV